MRPPSNITTASSSTADYAKLAVSFRRTEDSKKLWLGRLATPRQHAALSKLKQKVSVARKRAEGRVDMRAV